MTVRRAMVQSMVWAIVRAMWDPMDIQPDVPTSQNPYFAGGDLVEGIVDAVVERARQRDETLAGSVIPYEHYITEEIHKAFPWSRP